MKTKKAKNGASISIFRECGTSSYRGAKYNWFYAEVTWFLGRRRLRFGATGDNQAHAVECAFKRYFKYKERIDAGKPHYEINLLT